MQLSETAQQWDRLVAQDPKAPALLMPDGIPISRAKLDEFAQSRADELDQAKLRPRNILLFTLPNGIEWMATFLACLKRNIVAAPLDPTTSQADQTQLATQVAAAALWTQETLTCFDERRPKCFNAPIALAKFTSGSTALPKSLFFSDSEISSDGKRLIEAMRIQKKDINIGVTPWGHSYGLGNIVMPLLWQGTATTWCYSPFPHEISSTIQTTAATIFPAVPTLLRALVKSDCQGEDLKPLRLVITAGSRLDPEIAQKFYSKFSLKPRNLYGSSETGSICYDAEGEATLSGRGVGKPLPGVRLSWKGNRFRVNSSSVYSHRNLSIKGSSGSHFQMPDFGLLNEFGELSLYGRTAQFAKIGGRRISLIKVASLLESLEGVEEAIVYEASMDGEPCLVAAVASRSDRSAIAGEMRKHIPAMYRPRRWVALKALPCTSRGKIDRARIFDYLDTQTA